MSLASTARARSADSRLSTRSRASAGTASGQRAARTLSELSKFTQPGVGFGVVEKSDIAHRFLKGLVRPRSSTTA